MIKYRLLRLVLALSVVGALSQPVHAAIEVPVQMTGALAVESSSSSLEQGSQPGGNTTAAAELLAAKAVNPDIRGLITVPGTNIRYIMPKNNGVVCTAHGVVDNCYYMTKSITGAYAGKYDNNGAVYLDFRNTLDGQTTADTLDPNTVIYGHNWTNIEAGTAPAILRETDKMFAQLPSFNDYDFANSHRYFTIETETQCFTFVIFAAGYVNAYNKGNENGFYYIGTDMTGEMFQATVNGMKSRSIWEYSVPVLETDKIATLSTCSLKYGRDGNQRFVVMGRLLREGETLDDFPIICPRPVVSRP